MLLGGNPAIRADSTGGVVVVAYEHTPCSPVAFVLVGIAGTPQRDATDLDGLVRFTGVPAGPHIVEIQVHGVTRRIPVHISPERPVVVTIDVAGRGTIAVAPAGASM
jgi:hypothetical protein